MMTPVKKHGPKPYPPYDEKIPREVEDRLNRRFPAERGGRFDREGKPIGLGTFCRLFENNDYRIVKVTKLSRGFYVSTVWLGLNHAFRPGPPVIFETMVFNSGDDDVSPTDRPELMQRRYSTEEEALRGHAEITRLYAERNGLQVVKDEGSQLPD